MNKIRRSLALFMAVGLSVSTFGEAGMGAFSAEAGAKGEKGGKTFF